MNSSINSKISFTRLSNSSWYKIEFGGYVLHLDPGYIGDLNSLGIHKEEFIDKADLILISHCHKDHLQLEAIQAIKKESTQIIGPKCCAEVIYNCKIMKPKETFIFNDLITISTVDAYNTLEGHSTRKFHQKGDFVGYLLKLKERTIYFAGDTDVIPEMKELGKVDIAMLPISGIYVMDMEEAVMATSLIKPEVVIPMHQGNNQMDEFKNMVQTINNVGVKLLNINDKWVID